jgi:hypothetical protein
MMPEEGGVFEAWTPRVTRVQVAKDDPSKGARVATAEVELEGMVWFGGFAVYPDRSGLGLRVLPPSSRDVTGRKVPLFRSLGGRLEKEIARRILDELERIG